MDFTKPRIAIYYDVLPQTNFRNDGAPLAIHYNLQKLLNNKTMSDLQREGMTDSGNVVHLSPINPTSQHGKFDLNILVDYGEDVLGIPLDWELPHPNVYWAFDTHIDEKGYKYRLERAKQFDYVFLCHKAQIADFIRDGIDPQKIHYMPVAAETDCYRPYPIMPKWNWSFIGHFNSQHRIDLLDRFVKEFGLGDQKGYLGYRIPQIQGHCVLDDAAKKFSMSRLTLNYSIRGDLAMRVFETMACRTVLLTDEIPTLLELFKDGEHLVTFKTIDEAVEKARELLADPERRTRIAEAGYQEIISKHTYRHRTLEILKTVLNWAPKGELQPCH
jgi:glycosyltransferase involved in cell wall biosynthesis